MRIYFDENLPPNLAKGLDILEKPNTRPNVEDIKVLSIQEVFGKGAKDEVWLPAIGKEGAVVITQDMNIQRTKAQKELYQQFKVGVFFWFFSISSG